MKIAVFGATGLTGGLVVAKALEQGHEVVALVRQPEKVSLKHPKLQVVGGLPTKMEDVEKVIRGYNAVIHCLGIGGKGDGKKTTLVSDSVKAVLQAMAKHQVPRIVCMSNVGAGGSGPWYFNYFVVPLAMRFLKPIVEDKNRMEDALRASSSEWVSVRLPGIVEGPEKPVRVSQTGTDIGFTITASSVAKFLLEQVTSKEFIRSTPTLCN